MKLKSFNKNEQYNKNKKYLYVGLVSFFIVSFIIAGSYAYYQKENEGIAINGIVAEFCQQCIVSFDSNGGNNTITTLTLNKGEAYGTLPTATKDNNEFLGWYTEPTGGNKIISSDIFDLQSNQTLYAHWQEVTAPIIQGGNQTAYNGWVTSATISLQKESTAASGIKTYEYYQSRSATTPSSSTEATGTTSGNLSVELNGPSYTWYRALSNDGVKSTWSNVQLVKKDIYYNSSTLTMPYSISSSSRTTVVFGEFIPIDATKTYKESITVKTNNANARYYIGFYSYDVDYNLIDSSTVMFEPGTTTYLTKDLNPGDTTVYLSNVSSFVSTTTTTRLGFIFWNYTDSTGYTYPKETYSRNYYWDLYTYANINKTNNTIRLNSAWTGPIIKAGTYLSQPSNGGSHNYGILNHGYLTTTYQTYTNTITGYGTNLGVYGGHPVSVNKFMPGTKYIKLFLNNNYDSISPNVTTTVSSFTFTQIN